MHIRHYLHNTFCTRMFYYVSKNNDYEGLREKCSHLKIASANLQAPCEMHNFCWLYHRKNNSSTTAFFHRCEYIWKWRNKWQTFKCYQNNIAFTLV